MADKEGQGWICLLTGAPCPDVLLDEKDTLKDSVSTTVTVLFYKAFIHRVGPNNTPTPPPQRPCSNPGSCECQAAWPDRINGQGCSRADLVAERRRDGLAARHRALSSGSARQRRGQPSGYRGFEELDKPREQSLPNTWQQPSPGRSFTMRCFKPLGLRQFVTTAVKKRIYTLTRVCSFMYRRNYKEHKDVPQWVPGGAPGGGGRQGAGSRSRREIPSSLYVICAFYCHTLYMH